jgi:malate synthase
MKIADSPTQQKVQIEAPILPPYVSILTSEALRFLEDLHIRFDQRRLELLIERNKKQKAIDQGQSLDFLSQTSDMRDGEWQATPVPEALQERRVEITGPVDRKMIINALNSGANVFMADFEDSNSPTWHNVMDGQVNLMEAVRGTISYQSGEKIYTLNEKQAVLKVRPRGWHLNEKHITIDGNPLSASLVDFGLFIFHNGSSLAAKQRGPFFYLPKLESHYEARLWNDVFLFAEKTLGLAHGTIKATVLIETITAAFEMEEIIYELREHIAGLNAGRWDYLFSMIKKFKSNRAFITPDRATITMAVPFMEAYAKLLVKTCHRRGTHAIGGMSAFIPSKDDAVNQIAFEKVRADKEREAKHGYDGTWVAHPKLVAIAKEEFDEVIKNSPHQKHMLRSDVHVSASDLLNVSSAGKAITEKGVRTNINVTLLYLESWLGGVGAAALHNLMEDAATAEISRAQLWQWLHHQVALSDGRVFSPSLYKQLEQEEMNALLNQFKAENRNANDLLKARTLLDTLVLSDAFEDFLTTLAYPQLN